MGIIVSSFIGCGKNFLKNTYGDKIDIFDAVSEIEVDENSEDSLETYFNTVMDCVNNNDIVFIGFSQKIRELFNKKNIDYDIFYPSKKRRGEFIENQVRKRTKPNLIRDLDINFDKWIDEIEDDEAQNCFKHKLEGVGEFLGNNGVLMQYINSINHKKQEK